MDTNRGELYMRVDGWHSDDPEDDNYRPTIFQYKENLPTTEECARDQRRVRRNLDQELLDSKKSEIERQEHRHQFSLFSHGSYTTSSSSPAPGNTTLDVDDHDDTHVTTFVENGMQCDPDPLLLENQKLKEELDKCTIQMKRMKWGVDKISGNDAATKFYTGMPSYATFLWLFQYLKPKAQRMRYWGGTHTDQQRQRSSNSTSLSLINQLFAVLLRLRLGLLVQDLADRFSISVGTFSRYFSTWIALLHIELRALNTFPSRDVVDTHMPEAFKKKYPSVRVIIDCTEIFVQISSSLVNQNVTFSNYKQHNTFKFLVGITPSGVISFVSEGWGGRVSDRQITIESGILDFLQANDSVMADKGFTIRDLLQERHCTLNIPPFRGVAAQFTTEQVFQTREIAELRIHVERSIGRVKNFHIFDGILPLTLAPPASKIVQVACWLTNFDVPLVT